MNVMRSLWSILSRAARRGAGATDPPKATAGNVTVLPGQPKRPALLFVDYDALVADAERCAPARPKVAALLEACPNVNLVLLVSHRLWPTTENLALPAGLQFRIAGVIDDVTLGQFARQTECVRFARDHAIDLFLCADDDQGYMPGCPFLFRTDRYAGLDDDAVAALIFLMRSMERAGHTFQTQLSQAA